MRKIMKRALSLALVLILALSLAACGGKGGDNEKGSSSSNSGSKGNSTSAASSEAKQYVYKGSEIDLGGMISQEFNFRTSKMIDGTVYIVGNDWNVNVANLYRITMDTEANNVSKMALENPNLKLIVDPYRTQDEGEDVAIDDLSIDMDAASSDIGFLEGEEPDYSKYEYESYNQTAIANDGSIYAIRSYDVEDYSGEGTSIHENYVVRWDKDGNFLWETEIEKLDSEDNWRYVMNFAPMKEGGVAILLGGNNVSKLTVDENGNASPSLDFKNDVFDRSNSFITGRDDELYLTYWDANYDKCLISKVDVLKGTVGESMSFPQNMMWNSRSTTAGVDCDLIVSSEDGVYKYNIGDAAPTKIMDYIDSDYTITGFNSVTMLDEQNFIGCFYSETDYTQKCYKFTKVDPKDVKDKIVMTVGGFYVSSDVKKAVVNYNLSDGDYRFSIKDYSQYNNDSDYMAGYTKLNNDIIAGNCPDILVLNSNIPYESYAKKGLFADLEVLLDKDPEISKDKLLPNILDAFRVDGKLYQIFNTFSVQTMLAKTKWVGDTDTWTIKDMLAVLDRMPEGASAFGETTQSSLMYDAVAYSISDYLDVASGKCSFDSPEFIDLLEYIKTLPAEFDDSYWEDYDWQANMNMYREDRALLASRYIYDVNDLKYAYNQNFGEEIEFIGFPTAKGNGSVIGTEVSYAISAKAANVDEAWKVIRFFLTDDFFKNPNYYYYGLPLRSDILREKVDDLTRRPYWLDENGNKNEYDDYIDINGESVISEPFSQAMADKVYDFLTSVSKVRYYNENIESIITEETAPFFEGQKSAADVAKIIQSRIQIYVNENN